MSRTVTATQTAYNTDPSYAADGITTTSNKWFSLQENKLDGSYKLLGAGTNPGWWGTTLSDSNGDLSSTPTLIIDEVRTVWSIDIYGDAMLDEYPVDFEVQMYNGDTSVFYEHFSGNNSVAFRYDLPQAVDVTRVVFRFERVNKAGRTIKIVEALPGFQINRSDALGLATGESNLLSLGITAGDVLNVAATDDAAVRVRLSGYDDLRYLADDSSFFKQLEKWSNDSLALRGVEVTQPIRNTVGTHDALNVSVQEANDLQAWLVRSDVLSCQVGDGHRSVTSKMTRADTLDVRADAASSSVTNRFNRPDAVRLGTTYGDVLITNSFKRVDSLIPRLWETKHVTAIVPANEMVPLSSAIEDYDFTAELFRNDKLKATYGDSSAMTNIHTVMDADVRQIFGKVEITYTDPFNDETLSITASETGRYTYADELADSITTPAHKWFSLHDNKLDGSYHPLPSGRELSVGWWSTTMSDADGYLPDSPSVVITFSPRKLTTLKVVGDSLLECFPTDFTFNVYDAEDTLILSRVVTDNELVRWEQPIVLDELAAKMEVLFHRINRPFSTVKLTELFTAVVQVYDNDLLESINILEEIGYSTGSLPIGNVSANEVDIVISNDDRRFDLNNRNSSLHGFVKRNRRVRVWLGAYVGDTLEWSPMGVYWTTSWDIPRDAPVASLTARDRLELLRLSDLKAPTFVDKTLHWLFEYVLQDAGLRAEEYILDPSLEDIIIPYAWFGKVSHREALAILAGCAIVQVYCTKEGKIRVNMDLDATPHPMHTFDDDVNVYSAKYPLAVSEQVNQVEVTSKQWAPGTLGVVYSGEEEIILDPGEVVTHTIEFDTLPVLSIEEPVVVADPGVVVESYTTYAWGMDIVFRNDAAAEAAVTSITVEGIPLENTSTKVAEAKNEVLIREDGKMVVTHEHDFIQSNKYAQQLANRILQAYEEGRYDVTLDNRGNIALRLGDRVLVNDGYDQVQVPYVVTRQNISWNGFLQVVTEGKRL